MQATSHNIKEFLTYQMSKPTATDTDRFIFLLLVLEPGLFHKAVQWVFPEKNATVTNDSPEALRRFATAYAEDISLPGAITIHPEKVDFTVAINALFL